MICSEFDRPDVVSITSRPYWPFSSFSTAKCVAHE
jgi:hypothetical protein